MIRGLKLPYFSACLVGAALWAAPTTAFSAPAAFVPGQLVLYCQPGTAQAVVNTLAAKVNATVTPLLLQDCYELTLPAAQQDNADTLNAVAALKTDPNVKYVGPNIYYQTQAAASVTPNDPLYVSQWALPQINMPQAWVLQKGNATGTVADLDSGFDVNHPDMVGQYLLPGYNSSDGSTNIAPPNTTQEGEHGVFTSGVIDAKTNNGIGIASVAGWGTMQVFPVRISDANNAIAETALINAWNYVVQNKAKYNIAVVNMSFGADLGTDPNNASNPDYTSLQNLNAAGILMSVSAGNSTANDNVFSPAGVKLPLLLTVSALNRESRPTYYTNFGKIDISAPGGEQFSATDPNGMLGLYDGGYDYEQGTSFSAPMVSGVLSLLMSTSGVTPAQAVQLIENGANHTITGQTSLPDQYFGYGELDAYQALLPVSYTVSVVSPNGLNATGVTTDPTGALPQPIETLKPTIQFQVSRIPISNVNINIQNADGSLTPLVSAGSAAAGVTNFTVAGDSTGLNGPYTISLRYAFSSGLSQQNVTVVITGQPTDATVAPITDTRTFTLEPHVFTAGLNMVSFPYYESAADSPTGATRSISQILGTNSVVLYRYVPQLLPNSQNAPYASNGTTSDVLPADASLNPSDVQTTTSPVNGNTNINPLGLGYFMLTTSSTTFNSFGTDYSSDVVQVQLHDGWNMIGDPFPYSIPFQTIQFVTPSGSLYTAPNAAASGLILPYLYTYQGGAYQFNQLPGGTLQPWQGAWIYVQPGSNTLPSTSSDVLTMIVPPAGTLLGKAAAKAPAASSATTQPAAGWQLTLSASSGGVAGSTATLGVVPSLTRGAGAAPLPPQMGQYVSIALQRQANRSLLYMSDLHTPAAAQTWNLLVNTSQNHSGMIAVTWPGMEHVPHNVSLTLTDPVTGQSVNMRTNTAYQFQMAAGAATRSLTVTAGENTGTGRPVLSGLMVNQVAGRGTSGTIYNIQFSISRAAQVNVEVLGLNGRSLATVAPSRAVTAGQNQMVWNGRDAAGRALPSGVYTLVINAVTESGQTTRLTYPVTLLGR